MGNMASNIRQALVEGPVALLRKNALKFLRVPEFAPHAEFREPCVTFVLRDAVCSYCSDCRDLDLCRDARLVEEGRWDCSTCGWGLDCLLVVYRPATAAFSMTLPAACAAPICTHCSRKVYLPANAAF